MLPHSRTDRAIWVSSPELGGYGGDIKWGFEPDVKTQNTHPCFTEHTATRARNHCTFLSALPNMSAKVVAIAGAGGYVGKSFADALLDSNKFDVRILTRESSVSNSTVRLCDISVEPASA